MLAFHAWDSRGLDANYRRLEWSLLASIFGCAIMEKARSRAKDVDGDICVEGKKGQKYYCFE